MESRSVIKYLGFTPIIQYWNNEVLDSHIGLCFNIIYDELSEKTTIIQIIHIDLDDFDIVLNLSNIIITIYIGLDEFTPDSLRDSDPLYANRQLSAFNINITAETNTGEQIYEQTINFSKISQIYRLINIPNIKNRIHLDQERIMLIKFFHFITKIVKIVYDKKNELINIIKNDNKIDQYFNIVLTSINNSIVIHNN